LNEPFEPIGHQHLTSASVEVSPEGQSHWPVDSSLSAQVGDGLIDNPGSMIVFLTRDDASATDEVAFANVEDTHLRSREFG